MTQNFSQKFYNKNCLFGATNIVKNSDREKYVYSGYGIAFVGKVSWSLGNDCARNFVIFGVDNSSSSYTDNQKKNFSVLSEGDTFGINGRFDAPEKKFSINFGNAKTAFCLSLVIRVICLLLGEKPLNLKLTIKMLTFQLNFVSEVLLIKCSLSESKEVSLKGNVYDFSVDYNLIVIDDILDIRKYLIKKNDVV